MWGPYRVKNQARTWVVTEHTFITSPTAEEEEDHRFWLSRLWSSYDNFIKRKDLYRNLLLHHESQLDYSRSISWISTTNRCRQYKHVYVLCAFNYLNKQQIVIWFVCFFVFLLIWFEVLVCLSCIMNYRKP